MALSQCRFLFWHHLPSIGAAASHVHTGFREGAHGRLGHPLERDDCGSGDPDLSSSPALCRSCRTPFGPDRRAPDARAAGRLTCPRKGDRLTLTGPTGDTEIRDVGRPWWKGDAREAELFGDRDEIAKRVASESLFSGHQSPSEAGVGFAEPVALHQDSAGPCIDRDGACKRNFRASCPRRQCSRWGHRMNDR